MNETSQITQGGGCKKNDMTQEFGVIGCFLIIIEALLNSTIV